MEGYLNSGVGKVPQPAQVQQETPHFRRGDKRQMPLYETLLEMGGEKCMNVNQYCRLIRMTLWIFV